MSADIFKVPLRRDRKRAKLAGICAGIARSLEVEPWVVRLGVIFGFFITGGGPMLLAYLIAFIVIDADGAEQPSSTKERVKRCVNEIKDNIKGTDTKEKVSYDAEVIEKKLLAIKQRIESLEAEVTSSRFIIDQELSNISRS
ncbi:MAG: PspC domain-containing protein [Gammaproteobacteria bacterium]|nr:PspC domain-containing protein [Gammaproteobacteria bacterium]NVK89404.1 PspC domain-containing protein [Gammaproteobacteria bacterium]